MDEDFDNALRAFCLASVMAVSPHPANDAVCIPGEPRVVDGVILNCVRVQSPDEDLIPPLSEALLGVESLDDWHDVYVEHDCHFINVHAVSGAWRIDVSFHYLLGSETLGSAAVTLGVVGVQLMGTTRLPEDRVREAVATLDGIGAMMLDCADMDEGTAPSSSLIH